MSSSHFGILLLIHDVHFRNSKATERMSYAVPAKEVLESVRFVGCSIYNLVSCSDPLIHCLLSQKFNGNRDNV